MEDIVRKICEENNINYKTKIAWSPYLMICNHRDKSISFNPDRCIAMAIKLNMSLERFIEFSTYHEIGHCIDFKTRKCTSNVLDRETTAWELSRKLVDTALLKEYDKFNEINLASYRKKLQIKS